MNHTFGVQSYASPKPGAAGPRLGMNHTFGVQSYASPKPGAAGPRLGMNHTFGVAFHPPSRRAPSAPECAPKVCWPGPHWLGSNTHSGLTCVPKAEPSVVTVASAHLPHRECAPKGRWPGFGHFAKAPTVRSAIAHGNTWVVDYTPRRHEFGNTGLTRRREDAKDSGRKSSRVRRVNPK